LRAAYAPMLGRINPPSFLDTMTTQDIIEKAKTEDFFLALDGDLPIACGFAHGDGPVYEIGKIAVSPTFQRRGLCRDLLATAERQGKLGGAEALQLYVRVELTENQDVYQALGFVQVATFTHPGFDRPTAFILRRPIEH